MFRLPPSPHRRAFIPQDYLTCSPITISTSRGPFSFLVSNLYLTVYRALSKPLPPHHGNPNPTQQPPPPLLPPRHRMERHANGHGNHRSPPYKPKPQPQSRHQHQPQPLNPTTLTPQKTNPNLQNRNQPPRSNPPNPRPPRLALPQHPPPSRRLRARRRRDGVRARLLRRGIAAYGTHPRGTVGGDWGVACGVYGEEFEGG